MSSGMEGESVRELPIPIHSKVGIAAQRIISNRQLSLDSSLASGLRNTTFTSLAKGYI